MRVAAALKAVKSTSPRNFVKVPGAVLLEDLRGGMLPPPVQEDLVGESFGEQDQEAEGLRVQQPVRGGDKGHEGNGIQCMVPVFVLLGVGARSEHARVGRCPKRRGRQSCRRKGWVMVTSMAREALPKRPPVMKRSPRLRVWVS